jgi:uncharacterized protein (TIGR03086 family)
VTQTNRTANDAFDLLPGALSAFGARVRAVPEDRWSAPTPDEDWTVRDLVNHVVSEHFWVSHLLAGETIEDVGDRYEGDVLGNDPVDAWDSASKRSHQAWRAAEPDQVVHLSAGPTPASEYAEQMLLDLLVHGWDLARAAGLDERMDHRTVQHVLAYVRRNADQLRSSGMFGEPVDAGTDDPQSQLLGLLGRRP